MFTVPITPRFCETDALGHINNTVMPVWLEQGRNPVFELFVGDLTHVDLGTFPLLLVHLSMDFRHIVRFGQAVEVGTSVSRVGNSSFTLSQYISQNQTRCVDATAVIVHANPATSTAEPLPPTIRSQLMDWMQEAKKDESN